THGASVSFSGRIYNSVQYGLNYETGEIDYDQIAQLAQEHKPRILMGGFSAYSRVVDWQKFRDIADSVGAYLVVDMAHISGLVAAGVYPSPVQIADVTTSTTHKTLRGPRGGIILAKSNPTLEKKLDFSVFPESQGGPLMHVIAAKAICFREAMSPEFRAYQEQVIKNAQVMAQGFIDRGYDIVSGGTDDHLFLLSLIRQGITGKDADAALDEANITVNKNAVPNDPNPPFVTSGLRIGTPAITTRGFVEADCAEMTGWICDVLDDLDNREVRATVKEKVLALCAKYPVYHQA
ncbi:MAG: serine hydroxymethyltransferase, partial [Pseudomonadota bacterium]|nr:serine hydroxymethyltransferase [Pseudomonadota bacterium]